MRHNTNIAAVRGIMATGGGHAKMSEILSVLDIPPLDKKLFMKIEQIGSVWKEAITANMIEAGKDEKQLAVARGKTDEDVPAIQ